MTASPPLRLLMTTDAVGGVFTYASGLARRLADGGDEVTLVVAGPPLSTAQREEATGPRIHVVETDIELEWRDPEGRDRRRSLALLRDIARDASPDVIHVNGYRDALAGFDRPVVVVAHSCVGTWWRACRDDAPSPRWARYFEDVGSALREADAWAAPTLAFRDEMQAMYRAAGTGRVVWNGLDARPGEDIREPCVLAAGRMWDPAKGLDTIAAARIPDGWRLHIAGPRSELDPGLPRAQLIEDMRRAAIFVSAAVYEPFGLTVLEAAGAGCALALSDIPTFRELWDGAALFFPPGDGDALSAVLARLGADAGLRDHLRRKAAARAQRYGAAEAAARMRRLYVDVIAARTRRPAAESAA